MMTDWDERFRRGEHTNDPPHPLVVKVASELPAGRALDLACGTGRHSIYLAERGWHVTAVDNSYVAIEVLRQRSKELGSGLDIHLADLEKHDFAIEPSAYDLILDCLYLQRDLFPAIREGIKAGGVMLAVIAMIDDDPDVKPMNPAFLLQPGELLAEFRGWEIVHYLEGKPNKSGHPRMIAEIICVRRENAKLMK